MNIPTEQQCLDYFEQYKVPKNIFQHCLKVREVAVFLAKKLKEADVDVDIKLVGFLAFLHDLFKAVTLKELKPNPFHDYRFSEEEIEMWKLLREKYEGLYENEIAYLVLKDEFPEFAKVLKRASDPWNENPTWEELIVSYADKRVFKKEVVTLSERLEYLQKIYPREGAVWEGNIKLIKELEQKLFSRLGFLPDELGKALGREMVRKVDENRGILVKDN